MSTVYKASLTLVAAAVTSAVLVSSTAFAKTQSEPVVVTATRDAVGSTRHVSYRDLDLVLASHRRALHRRVDVAVKDVCAVDADAARTLSSYSSHRTCSNFAWNGARPQIAAAIARAQAGASGSKVAAVSIAISAPGV